MKRTPFTLKSGNATAFKNMGSYSPIMQTDDTAATTTKSNKLGEALTRIGEKLQAAGANVEKFKAKRKADDIAKNLAKGSTKEVTVGEKTEKVGKTSFEVRKEKDARMRKEGKSQYQLDQIDAAKARKQAKKAATKVETKVVTPVDENGDKTSGDVATGDVATGDKTDIKYDETKGAELSKKHDQWMSLNAQMEEHPYMSDEYIKYFNERNKIIF